MSVARVLEKRADAWNDLIDEARSHASDVDWGV